MTHLPPIGPVRSGCLNCPPRPELLPLEQDTDPGFGYVELLRDGQSLGLFMQTMLNEDDDATTMLGQDFEDRAAGDPDHDWRLKIESALSGAVYQRQGEGRWVAVERLAGFA